MPVHDWQFWIVTLLMLLGLRTVFRAVKPARKRSAQGYPSCPTCASDSASSKPKRRVALTIERRKI